MLPLAVLLAGFVLNGAEIGTADAQTIATRVPDAACARGTTPSTGSYLVRRLQSGMGELTIENGLAVDALVQVTPRGGPTEIAVYLRGRSNFTIKGIPDGSYVLYFTTGRCWDTHGRRFYEPQDSRRFQPLLNFQTHRVGTQTQYSTFTVTLHGVAGGNAATEHATPPPL